MTALPHRLAYDDATSPHEMYGDCQAASMQLHKPMPTAPASRSTLEDYRRQPPTMYVVHEDVAVLAGSLHLYFD